MAQREVAVTALRFENGRLPDEFASFVALGSKLTSDDFFAEASGHVQLDRRPGYEGVDVLAFLVAFFHQGGRGGIRGFSDRCRPFGQQLAAVCGRSEWPTQGSISRALSSISEEQLEGIGRYLLTEAVDFGALVGDPSVVCRDPPRRAVAHVGLRPDGVCVSSACASGG